MKAITWLNRDLDCMAAEAALDGMLPGSDQLCDEDGCVDEKKYYDWLSKLERQSEG